MSGALDFELQYEKAMQLTAAGFVHQAIEIYNSIIRSDADALLAHYGLIPLLLKDQQTGRAHALAQHLTQLEPDQHEAWTLRAMAARNAGNLEDAVGSAKTSYAKGSGPGMLSFMGVMQLGAGLAKEAITSFDEALKQVPNNDVIHSNRLFAMTCCPGITREQLAQAHFEWGRRVESRVPFYKSRKIDKKRERKLKVGYVSADFHHHPVSSLIEPILQNHDRNAFELHCFDNQKGAGDDVTQRFKTYFDGWHHCAAMDDKTMAQTIHDLAIDVLVDLSGHTAGNRLPVFAIRPAPVQVSWFGYMTTTGLKRMDYRFTDFLHSPEGVDVYYSEKLYRLSAISPWQPYSESPAVGQTPALANGYITFGAFNRWEKVIDEAISCWSQILLRCDHSRLRIVVSESLSARLKQSIEGAFLQYGIGPDRLLISGKASLPVFLSIVKAVDIALDTFPCNGGTTSLHTLWMGVPLVSLKSDQEFGRGTFASLTNAGLSYLCADSIGDYVDVAVGLASDVQGINDTRMALREKLMNSVLFDYKKITIEVEEGYRYMLIKNKKL